MRMRIYRRLTAPALLAGSLCLLASTVEAAPAARPARPAAARSGVVGAALDSAWSRLVHLFASDHSDSNGRHGGHSGGGPDTDEGPGVCPHGH